MDADDTSSTTVTYMSGFVESPIVQIDNISNSFGDDKRQFTITRNNERYEPVIDEYVYAIYDNQKFVNYNLYYIFY